MKPYLLSLAFRAMSKVNRDPEQRNALNQMADEMRSLSRRRLHGWASKPVNSRP